MRTYVNYVVEASKNGTTWLTMGNAGDDEATGREHYALWLASKRHAGGKTQYRLVRRTAVITDEVVIAAGEGEG